MKLSLDSLKSIDWKRVGVDHGERIAVGVVGLIVLMILGLGTRWSAYDAKDPQEIVQTVESERQELQRATWPPEEQRKYPGDYDVGVVVAREQGPVKLEPYDYPLGHPMNGPLTKQQQRYEEPVWLALEYGELRGGQVYLEVGGPQTLDADGMLADADGVDGAPGEAIGQNNVDNPFRKPGGALGDAEGFAADDDAPGESEPMGEFPDGMEGTEGMVATYPQVEGQSYRFASVRYVFPWKKQVEIIAKSRRSNDAQEYAKILAGFRIADFELQRQEARPGAQPWSDKDEDWETVSREMAMQVLSQVAGFELDIVDTGDIDPVITMPLPTRLDRQWVASEAGHKKLKTLDEKEMEQQRLLAEALLAQPQDIDPAENMVQLGGFFGVQADVRGAQMALQADRGARRNFMEDIREGAGNAMFAPGQLDSLENSLTAIPEYLLFRYFDFDVRPGVAYRYRARLTLTNPNFNTPLQMVSRPEISQGKTRTTPWSQPTPPAVIPPDVEVYLEDVAVDRGTSTAKVKVIQWLPEVGTLVTETLPITPGSRIYGRSKADVIEPGVTLEEREVAFAAPAVVVDAETGPAAVSNRSFHAELTLPPAANGQLEAVEQTLVANESGELEVLTPYTDEQKRKKRESYVAGLYKYHDHLRPAEMTAENMGEEGLDFLMGEGEGEGMAPPRRGRYSKSRSRSPLDRRGGAGAQSSQ